MERGTANEQPVNRRRPGRPLPGNTAHHPALDARFGPSLLQDRINGASVLPSGGGGPVVGEAAVEPPYRADGWTDVEDGKVRSWERRLMSPLVVYMYGFVVSYSMYCSYSQLIIPVITTITYTSTFCVSDCLTVEQQG